VKFLTALESDWDAHSICIDTSAECRTVSDRSMFLISIGLSRDTLGRKFRGNEGDRGEVLDGVGKRLGRTFYLYVELFGLCDS
jgi:hypothetical protein